MKRFYLFLSILFSFVIIFSVSACSYNDNNNSEIVAEFVGITFYQKADKDNNYNRYKNSPAQINNLITTENNKIEYTEEVEYLFYFYSQTKISNNTKSSDFLSNTTTDNFKIENNNLNISIERINEPTDVLIYFIYKNEDGSYYLSFQKEATNLNSEETELVLDITSAEFNKIHLTLNTNLTSTKNY